MKDIIYVSNAYNCLYADNCNSGFQSHIDERSLDYLSSKDNIDAGIKFISFLLPEAIQLPLIVGVKSTVSRMRSVRSNIYETIIGTFALNEPTARNISIYFKRPLFFPTTIENLCRASFSLINMGTNDELKQENPTNPTVICLCVRESLRMDGQHQLNMLLQSDNAASKLLYPDNNTMSFRIHLPRRFDLTKNWSLTLKSIHLTNEINNIQDDYWFKVVAEEYTSGRRASTRVTKSGQFSLPTGYYSNVAQLYKAFSSICAENNLPLRSIYVTKRSQKKLVLLQQTLTEERSKNRVTNMTVTFSPKLARLLGFSSRISDTIKTIKFTKLKRIEAEFPISLWDGWPTHICVQCDLAEKMIVGSKPMRTLRCINISEERENRIMSFSFAQNDFSQLAMTSFDSIHIRITDLEGKLLKANNSTETIVQLMFRQIYT